MKTLLSAALYLKGLIILDLLLIRNFSVGTHDAITRPLKLRNIVVTC